MLKAKPKIYVKTEIDKVIKGIMASYNDDDND